jgi:uncharacterized small protein (DUF1192 family)
MKRLEVNNKGVLVEVDPLKQKIDSLKARIARIKNELK